jgi:methionyl-tRNA synthetase
LETIMNTHFVSTAIPYVNAAPHIGFALELVIADVIARHSRQRGRRVYFLTGTDDNSLKNALAAEAEGLATARLVRRNTAAFRALQPQLDVSADDFISTSADPRHAPAVLALWHACERNGDVYRGRYSGLYCVGCERFYAEAELVAGRCPDHGQPLEQVAEENWFFRLSRYQDALIRLIGSDELAILPRHRRNEVLSFLEAPLEDLSISRSAERARGWGIPVPGDPSQIVYVWFDALANYVSAPGYADRGAQYQCFWEGGDRISHVIGKGVLRFHAVYWPAILLSAGVRRPTELLVHGYVTVDGRKIGKSLGNAVAPDAASTLIGTDALRYYLLRHVGSHRDGDFSLTRCREAYDHELANQLGNLLARTIGLARRYGRPQQESAELAAGLEQVVGDHIDAFAVHKGLEEIFRVIAAANAFVSRTEPWALARAAQHDALAAVLGELFGTLRVLTTVLAPFLPQTAIDIIGQLGSCEPQPLFPRLDIE